MSTGFKCEIIQDPWGEEVDGDHDPLKRGYKWHYYQVTWSIPIYMRKMLDKWDWCGEIGQQAYYYPKQCLVNMVDHVEYDEDHETEDYSCNFELVEEDT